MGRAGEIAGADTAIDNLEKELGDLMQALDDVALAVRV
jgi:hypothetical protein